MDDTDDGPEVGEILICC